MPSAGLAHLLIGQPSLASLVARSLATKGEQPRFIDDRYQLGINALDLAAMEYRWLRRQVTYEHFLAQAAVAAQFGIIAAQLNVPNRSNLIVIEKVILTNTTAARLGYRFGVTFGGAGGVGAGATAGRTVDDRGFGSNSQLTLASGSNAVDPLAGSQVSFVSLASGTSIEIAGPWILTGRDNGVFSGQFVVVGDVVNATVIASIRWSERELLASEL